MAESKRPGLAPLPTGLLRPTTPPSGPTTAEGPGDDQGGAEGQGVAAEARPAAPRSPRRPRRPPASGETKGRKIHLPDDVHDRLQLLAMKRRTTISAVASEILDRNLPRLRIELES